MPHVRISRRRAVVLLLAGLVLVGALAMLAIRVESQLDAGWAGFAFQGASPEDLDQLMLPVAIGGGSRMVIAVASRSPAEAAGIVIGDRIRSIDRIPVEDGPALLQLARAKRPGDTVVYQIEHNDELREVRLELGMAYRSPHVVAGVVSSLLVGLAFLAISTLVAWAQPSSKPALVFFLMSLAGAAVFLVWAVVEPDLPDLGGLIPVGLDPTTALAFIGFTVLSLVLANLLLHLVLVFPEERPVLRRWPEVLHWAHTLPFLPFAAVPSLLLGGVVARHLAPIASYSVAGVAATAAVVAVARRARRSQVLSALKASPWVIQGGLLAAAFALGPALRALDDDRAMLVGILVGVGVVIATTGILLAWSVVTCVVLARGWRDAGIEARHQLRWPVWGTLVAIGGSTGFVVVIFALAALLDLSPQVYHVLSITITVLAKLIYVLIPVSFAFGILKYRLMSIDVIVRKTMVYAALTGFVIAGYLIIVGLFGLLLVAVAGVHSQVLTVIATVVVAALLIPVRSRIQTFVDRRFFRREREHDAGRGRIAALVRTGSDLATVLTALAEEIQRGLGCSSVALLVADPSGHRLRTAATIGISDGARDRITVSARDLPNEQVAAGDALALDERTRSAFGRGGPRLAAPARHRDACLGMVVIGRELNREPYGDDDRRFLADAAQQLALAVTTLQPRRAELEFDEAREIQRSLLPTTLPAIDGVEVAARWEPAREVSGDAYDVLRLDRDRVGLAIGDVAGKGMPAALLMSSLQAAVKAVAEAGRAPAEICARVRDVVRQNLAGGRFVTFFYAVLDRARGTLSWCNAGHVPTLLYRADGRHEWLATGGPAIARVLADGVYHDGQTTVGPGDIVVLFTDGVLEAASPTGELFGEERIVATVRAVADAPAAELARMLATAARAFSAGDAQDDVTVVVARVIGHSSP